MNAVITISGLAVSNFLFQFLQSTPVYSAAFDHSLAQAVAIGVYCFVNKG